MSTAPKKTFSDEKHQQDDLIAKTRPSKEELKVTTKKAINQYREAIKNLAKR